MNYWYIVFPQLHTAFIVLSIITLVLMIIFFCFSFYDSFFEDYKDYRFLTPPSEKKIKRDIIIMLILISNFVSFVLISAFIPGKI